MSDSEEYSSEDEDYLPSGEEEYSEDDVSELVKEEEEVKEEKKKLSPGDKRKKDPKGNARRQRKKRGGGLLLEPDGGESSKDDGKSESEDGEAGESHDTQLIEHEKRKKEEDLWASFLSDVGHKPKAASTGQASCAQKDKVAEKKSSCEPQETTKEPEKSKVAITKVFDFAGEEVRVTKEVDAGSKEAQLFLREQKAVSPATHPTVSGVKRPSGLNNLLGKIGSKKQKMSTLEKSKLDWESFKEQEGISDELAIHNRGKEGYLERKAFLERVDHRQFEIERDIRLSNMKP